MIGWLIEEETQEYTNLSTGDRWLLTAQVIESREGDGESYIVSLSARYLMEVDVVQLNTAAPWPGATMQEHIRTADIRDTQLFLRDEVRIDELEEVRAAKADLLRRLMHSVLRVDVIGQLPELVRPYLN